MTNPEMPQAPDTPADPEPAEMPVESQAVTSTEADAPVPPQPANMAMYQQPAPPTAGEQVIGKVAEMYKTVWKGETARAVDMLSELSNFWVIALASLAVVVGLVTGFTRSRLAGVLNADFLDSYGEAASFFDDGYAHTYLGFGFGKTIGIILAGILAVAVVYVARAFALTLVAKMRKVEYNFTDAMNLVGFAFLPVALVYVVSFILALIPTSGAVWAANLLMTGGLYPLILLGELLTYVAFNRQKRFTKSIVVPYVALSTAAVLAAGIIWQILKVIFAF